MRLENVLNKKIQFCFIFGAVCAFAAESAGTVSDVRADRRTGRLVRRVTIEPVVVQPVTPGSTVTNVKSKLPSLPLAKDARINEIVESAAKQYEVDPLLVHAVIQVESAYNPHAVSHAGAQGLMQLMPSTARSLGVRNSFDVEENIRAGVRHLRDLQDQYKDDRLALAAYNAGAGAVKRYGWIPPYAETQEYVYKVGKKYGEARRAAGVVQQQQAAAAAKSEVPKPAENEPRQVEAFVDADGRLHMRTK